MSGEPLPQSSAAQPSESRKPSLVIIGLVLTILFLGVSTGYLFLQLQQTNAQLEKTNSLLQHRIDQSDRFSNNCTGSWNANFTVLVETCHDNFGDTCTTVETISGTSETSTTTCTPP